jgi:hypothetical protein
MPLNESYHVVYILGELPEKTKIERKVIRVVEKAALKADVNPEPKKAEVAKPKPMATKNAKPIETPEATNTLETIEIDFSFIPTVERHTILYQSVI